MRSGRRNPGNAVLLAVRDSLGTGMLTVLMAGFCCIASETAAAEPEPVSPEAAEFFEKDIRPVLAERCHKCHGPKTQWAGLRLDSRGAMRKGGDSGPAVVPGKPDESELLRRVLEEDEALRMPPADAGKRLTKHQIDALTRWVRQGAPWPEVPAQSADQLAASQREHWAFQPVRKPSLPAVRDAEWVETPIDQFVLRRLETQGLEPSPPADRRTLIRRATYDLTGLPPTPAEVEAFVRDDSPDAYARLIDRLLESPHYGEQWGRHWLDVARYSDTKGYVYAREERSFVHASAYRDWVVRAFNDDLPYDRFLLLQLAADQAAPNDSPPDQGGAGGGEEQHAATQAAFDDAQAAAMGFLTLGRRFLGVTPDIIDDRIDVVTRGTMGLTVSCARCHDHKYDPIPTADYYSLYGVFQNSFETMVPVPREPGAPAPSAEFEAELQTRRQKLDETTAARRAEAEERIRQRVTDYLLAQRELDKYPVQGFDQILAKDDLIPAIVRRWQAYLARAAQDGDPVFVPWLEFAKLPDEDFPKKAASVGRIFNPSAKSVGRLLIPSEEPADISAGLTIRPTSDTGTDGLKIRPTDQATINPRIARAFAEPPASPREVAQRYGQVFAEIDRQWRELCETAEREQRPAPESLADPDDEALRQVLYGAGSPRVIPDEPIVNTESLFDSATVTELWRLQGEVDRWLLQSPESAPHAVILRDRGHRVMPRIFRRGNPANQGDEVPMQFVNVLAGPERRPFTEGSGRLELARAIVSPDNPLTARVWVNRVWMHHFGAGLVRTPSDFGLRAEAPSHPELLDWLADEFIRGGWSTKSLHRQIMLSAVYRQRSDGPADDAIRQHARQLDPENRLLWRMNARRLSFEELRDTLLAVSGELDPTLGGRPVELFPAGGSFRRSIYGRIDRQFVPGVLRVFDFANPDLHSPQRSETTVPQQALFALNHPFVADRAKALAASLDAQENTGSEGATGSASANEGATGSASADERVTRLYRAVFQREPTAVQRDAALAFIAAAQAEPVDSPPAAALAWSYGYGELDEPAGKLKSFEPLPHFTGSAWQGGPNWPDAKLGWAQLTAQGGHTGNDLKHAAIRRWTAPSDGTVSVQSTAVHQHAPGDGVRFWIVSSRHGVLASATLHNAQQPLNVEQIELRTGDTLDFIVDYNANLNSDMFLWAPDIRLLDRQPDDTPDGVTHWSAEQHFTGPRTALLDPWEQLAQVLLVSNELMFVD